MSKLFAGLAVAAGLILFATPPASAAPKQDGLHNGQIEVSSQRRRHVRVTRHWHHPRWHRQVRWHGHRVRGPVRVYRAGWGAPVWGGPVVVRRAWGPAWGPAWGGPAWGWGPAWGVSWGPSWGWHSGWRGGWHRGWGGGWGHRGWSVGFGW